MAAKFTKNYQRSPKVHVIGAQNTIWHSRGTKGNAKSAACTVARLQTVPLLGYGRRPLFASLSPLFIVKAFGQCRRSQKRLRKAIDDNGDGYGRRAGGVISLLDRPFRRL